jgi:hypothetical protein
MCRDGRRAGLAVDATASGAKVRAGRIALREPEASCRRAALSGSSRHQVGGNVHNVVETGGDKRAVRTAKPCGPGRRCYGQAFAEAAFASTGAVSATFVKAREANRNSAPGRARHKP